MENLRTLFLIHLGVVALSAVGLWLLSPVQVDAFLWGAALITVNFSLLVWLWRRILGKKSVALTLGLVVIKYAILAIVLYVLVKDHGVQIVPLCAGMASLGASFLIFALTTAMDKQMKRPVE